MWEPDREKEEGRVKAVPMVAILEGNAAKMGEGQATPGCPPRATRFERDHYILKKKQEEMG